MNKTVIISLIVVAVLVLGGVFYFGGQEQGDEVEMARQALMGSGSVACTFTDAETGERGDFYVKDGNMRASVDTMEGQQEMTVSMVLKDHTMYLWTEGEPQGIYFSIEEYGDEIETPFTEFEDEETFRQNFQEQQMSCQRERVSDSRFDLPSDVEFVDFAEVMMGAFSGGDMAPPMEGFDGGDMNMEEFEEMMKQLEEEFGQEFEMQMQMQE